ncbi:uncharacterized protein At3g60930, chloroplastic-like [Eutrema salsugineum]|uniref:uncharacterized protein At3g60930, chloroplastic-like n=1 Tax=Eutrema salsugineum TaxID=72664 RepID=UPI000CECF3D8|nr:uncharacterized protein At3g60930, chloroplastic-like [Eutrema salsugineum]
MARGLGHMIGILVRGFECGLDIELDHLLNLLEIRRAPKGGRFYISNKSNRWIIGGFPSKDQFWTECFFYVLVNEASVGEDFVRKTKTTWGPLVRSILPSVSNDLFTVRDTLAAQRVNWRKHFTFERVERARAIFTGVSVSSSSLNSSGDTREKMVVITLRDSKRREAEEAAKRAAEAAQTEAKAVTRDNLPSREGEDATRATETNVTEAIKKGVAPEVEPGEIIPEVSREDSAAQSKTPSNSKDKPSKKKRKPVPGDHASRKPVVDDPDASAVMFLRVNNANTCLPPPDQLSRPRSYGAMAQRDIKFVAAINELMAENESDLSKVESRLDEASSETATAKGKLDEAMVSVKRLEEEKIALRADVDKVSSTVTCLEEARRAKSAKVALL